MITLEKFESDLKDLIKNPTIQRPFVCEGSPLKCQVFIVGFNPATSMEADFWQFWDSNNGYNKATWLETYIEERKNRPLPEGKKRRTSISKTRRVIEKILQSTSPIHCLETNIYDTPTPKASDLKEKDTCTFLFLLNTIKPKIIVAHGVDAVKYVEGLGLNVQIIHAPHFSRIQGQEDIFVSKLSDVIKIKYDAVVQKSQTS